MQEPTDHFAPDDGLAQAGGEDEQRTPTRLQVGPERRDCGVLIVAQHDGRVLVRGLMKVLQIRAVPEVDPAAKSKKLSLAPLGINGGLGVCDHRRSRSVVVLKGAGHLVDASRVDRSLVLPLRLEDP